VLKGLNFYKDKQDPVAMADEEYPAWLWGVLEKGKGGAEAKGAGVDEGDLYGEFLRLVEVLRLLKGFGGRGRDSVGSRTLGFWGCIFFYRSAEIERKRTPARRSWGKPHEGDARFAKKPPTNPSLLSQPNQRNSANAPPKPCGSAPC